MTTVFSDMLEEGMEIIIDDFSVFGVTYDQCLDTLGKVLKRHKSTNLV